MDDYLRVLVFVCLIFWGQVFAQTTPHQSGGEDHIVIIDTSQATSPLVAEVLERLSLTTNHSDVKYIYNNSRFKGFSASMKSHCLDLLANMSDVSMVEKSAKIASARPILHNRQSMPYITRPSAPWGLQRISTALQMSGDPKVMDYTYAFANGELGKGVDIYIVDTGVYEDHNVFTGRARMLWSFTNDLIDNDGHGTHVAGTAAGSILGVASNANILGIKALAENGAGTSADVVAGIDLVIQTHEKRLTDPGYKGAIMSMSMASSQPVQAIDAAVQAAIKAGVHASVAAGNDHIDACHSSPAAAGGKQGGAITVGSVDINANPSSFSNYGNCVDIYAPGEDIVSSWIGAPNMVNSLSGTSMATPHVTGIIAYAMANETLAKDPGLMKEWIIMNALEVSNGLLLANNGVHQTDFSPDGMLGYSKIGEGPRFRMTARSSKDGEAK